MNPTELLAFLSQLQAANRASNLNREASAATLRKAQQSPR